MGRIRFSEFNGGHLGFCQFQTCSGNRKNDNIIFLHLAYILKLN